MSTKWLVVFVVLVASVVVGSQAKTWFDSQQKDSFVRGYDQAKAFYQPEAPKIIATFAHGLCHGNADELIASTSPNGSINEDDANTYVEGYVQKGRACKIVRYIGSIDYGETQDYFYEIRTSEHSLWYIFKADATGVLSVQ